MPTRGTNFSFNEEKVGEMGIKIGGDEVNINDPIDQSGIVKAMKILAEKQKNKFINKR